MYETLTGLLERGWCVHLFARRCTLHPQPGLRWSRIRTPRRPFTLAYPAFAAIAGIAVALRGRGGPIITLGALVPNRVDVITVQFCHAGFAAHGVARRASDTRVHALNDCVGEIMARGLERWSYRASRVRRMTAVSELVAAELQEHFDLGAFPIDVIPNGVDIERFRPDRRVRTEVRRSLGVSQDELVALFLGGDWMRKGLDIAIAASARAGWLLVVAGYGRPTDWSDLVAEHRARVIFHGRTPTPERLLAAADAFILPSAYEGFALVTVEAAASQLPLLVTEATGAGGLAASSGGEALPRCADTFAAALEALTDPSIRAERGRAAQLAAERQSWPRIVDAYESAYGAVC